ncbi:MAG: phosphoserine phosphatase SerB [Stappia sp.]|uniref:phosphoserine phosphatase SerB n=1 Tax=Stappia sp. TaxID=1870903 RepID=UPI000C58FE06|nr:phosphoserine phosphatase SerB [Stappia sp.]MAA97445.1 phosphoserine phosphatase SerB [Stappia sp.]MBM21978.1 phosphoserine phosphatase SerB [Stappia sp.]
MSLVATLVSAPQTPQLDSDLAGRAAEALGDLAAGSVETRVLAEGLAVDLFFEARSDGMSREADTRLREIVSSAPVDVLVQKHEGRRKRLLIADMDSTLIEQECIDELAAAVGKKDVIAAITERAMRGELEFEGALRERAGMLAGLPETVIAEVLSNQITLTPGAKALVATMKAHGAYCALVSGGFTAFTAEIAATLGMDENRANTLEIESGRLTGRVGEPILGRAAKRQRLQELIAELGLDASGTMAVGDGANDLAMIELAGLGVAFHAKPAVAAAADARVDHGDLTALLYFQGYTASEIRNA